MTPLRLISALSGDIDPCILTALELAVTSLQINNSYSVNKAYCLE